MSHEPLETRLAMLHEPTTRRRLAGHEVVVRRHGHDAGLQRTTAGAREPSCNFNPERVE